MGYMSSSKTKKPQTKKSQTKKPETKKNLFERLEGFESLAIKNPDIGIKLLSFLTIKVHESIKKNKKKANKKDMLLLDKAEFNNNYIMKGLYFINKSKKNKFDISPENCSCKEELPKNQNEGKLKKKSHKGKIGKQNGGKLSNRKTKKNLLGGGPGGWNFWNRLNAYTLGCATFCSTAENNRYYVPQTADVTDKSTYKSQEDYRQQIFNNNKDFYDSRCKKLDVKENDFSHGNN